MRPLGLMFRHALVAIVLAFGCAAPVAAGAFEEDAVEAYRRGNYPIALRLWKLQAEQGDTAAQGLLGLMYVLGQGAPQDFAETAKWLRKAAEHGNAGAQALLGTSYFNGYGVPQDYAEALTWYRKAADQGDATAQIELGLMYASGVGVSQDYVQAHMLFNLAAARLPASEAEKRNIAFENRDLVAVKMTSKQFAEAQRLAREWEPKSD